MNKTIIININGIVFHIEEDAYDILRSYMTDVKRHFAYSPDSEEIVTDIENRLAEMFNERLAHDHKQVIVASDVRIVTARMGNVNDFNLAGEEDQDTVNVQTPSRKLFRDPDDRMLGGVCSGLAHYLGTEPKWIRLALILSVLIAGFGIPLYIILWIVMPLAVNRADKMAMKGEPINLQNFKKNFDEEVEGLRGGINRVHKEASPAIDSLARFVGSAGLLAVKIMVALIAFGCIMGIIGLSIACLTFLGYWTGSQLNMFPFIVVNDEYKAVLTLSFYAIVIIPLAAIVLFAFKVLSRNFYISRYIYFGMLVIWLAALGSGVYHASKVTAEFNEEARFSVSTTLKSAPVYIIKVNPDHFFSKEDSAFYDIDPGGFKGKIIVNSRRGDLTPPQNVRLRIVRGDGPPVLVQEFSAAGPTFESALGTARKANHRIIQQDSVVLFDPKVYLQRGQLWRDQRVTMTLRIPEGTKLRLEATVNKYLEDYSLWECQPENASTDFLSDWTMTSSGLKCDNEGLYNRRDSISAMPGVEVGP